MIQILQHCKDVTLFQIGSKQKILYCFELYPKASHPYIICIDPKSNIGSRNFVKHMCSIHHGKVPSKVRGSVKHSPRRHYLPYELNEHKEVHQDLTQHIMIPGMHEGLINSPSWFNLSNATTTSQIKLSFYFYFYFFVFVNVNVLY